MSVPPPMPETTPLADLARLIRSKNAGPFWLTIDVMFDNPEAYRRACASALTSAEEMGRRLACDPGAVLIRALDPALAIKISIPRQHSAGSPQDADVLGGQQYAGLLDLPVPA